MSVKVFDLLTATPAPVSGKPEPTRSFQWLRNGTAISGANAQTYFLQPADEGALVSVRQIETNLIGKATATSATLGPVEAVDIVEATGGIETVIEQDGKFYRVHTFLESGDLTVTQGGEVEYLVVGGGGGGGDSDVSGAAGGGGAGQWKKFVAGEAGNTGSEPLAISAGVHDITVGPGGDGTTTATGSSIGSLVSALGGGRGGDNLNDGESGGSGGGAGAGSSGDRKFGGSGESVGGNDGGRGSESLGEGPGGGFDRTGGGGGGAGEAGADGVLGVPGKGGDGLETAIDGAVKKYAAGGGGGSRRNFIDGADGGDGGGGKGGRDGEAAEDGAPGTGSGGGGNGGSETSGVQYGPGKGGSGRVEIRYPITEAEYNAEAA